MRRVIETLVVAGILLAASLVTVADTRWIEDASGATVPIEAPVARIVSVYGLGTYYFYALGEGDLVILGGYIGVKTLAQAPEPLLEIEPLLAEKMTFGTPNLEAIASLDPDLVVVDAVRHAEFAELAEQVGLPVVRQKLETPDSVHQTMTQLAGLLGAEAVGRAEIYQDFVERVQTAVEQVSGAIDPEGLVSVLFLGSTKQTVASGDMLQDRMIQLAGGVSVSHQLTGSWRDVDLEQIHVWDPDVIVVPAYAGFAAADLLSDPDWAGLHAVQSERVYKMPRVMGPWDTAVPDFILGVLWMSDRFYPSNAEIDWIAETTAFYETFYDYTLPSGWFGPSE